MSVKRKAAEAVDEVAKKPKPSGSITSFFKPNASTTSASAGGAGGQAPAPKFNKAAWVEKLTAEQKELLKLEIETLHESWLAHLKDEITSPEFLELKKFLRSEALSGKKIFPPSADVYSWSDRFHATRCLDVS